MSFCYVHVKKYLTKGGVEVAICIDDAGEAICVKDRTDEKVGQFDLKLRDDNYFYLTWMYMDCKNASFKRQGIGYAALRFHREMFGLPIVAAENDGLQLADGSHLTGDAPGFVAKMREIGIIDSAQD